MILKTMHNRSARATIGYVAREGAVLLGGNMLGQTVDELTRELELLLSLRPSLSKPVVHLVGAFAPEDRLTDEEMLAVACHALQEQGYAESLYAVWRHLDGTTEHFHAVASQVDTAGKSISTSFERYKAKRTCRYLERQYGLQEISSTRRPEPNIPVPPAPPPEPDGLDIELPSLTSPANDALSREIREVLPACRTFSDLAQALYQRGITMVPQIHSNTGDLYGMGYRVERGPFSGTFLPGSKIHGNFSAAKLTSKHALSFEPERDLPVLRNPAPQCPPLPESSSPEIQKPNKPQTRRTKKGDRRHARQHRQRPSRVQSQEFRVWSLGPTSLQALLATGDSPQDTRLVRSLLGHPGGWAALGPPAEKSLFPQQRAGKGWLARPH